MTAPPDSSNLQSASETSSSPQDGGTSSSSVQVAVRVRPMLPHEAGNTQCVDVLSTSADLPPNVIRLGGKAGPKFTFDQVFPLETTQAAVYENRVAPLVMNCLEGYNATILAYGQTGSGKTHTIMGPSASIMTAVQDERQGGVIPRAIRNIFEQLEAWRTKNSDGSGTPSPAAKANTKSTYEYDVRVQFLEVYGQEIRDLLTTQQPNKKLSIRDVGMDEPEVVGATEQKVESAEEALLCLTRGMYRRVTGATAMNESSSRSHAILSLIVEQSNLVDEEDRSHTTDSEPSLQQPVLQAKRSKFNFVDLAGSERQKRTQSSGLRLKEGININQGLLVLGNVISALGDPKKQGKAFVPYRDSNLTRLLKGSLGGNHKTLMVACVSPASINMEETLNCLRYANRAKNIQNHAVVNLDATSRMVSELRKKLQVLASDLLMAREGNLNDCVLPIDVVNSLAQGGDGESTAFRKGGASPSPLPLHVRPRSQEDQENHTPSRGIGGNHTNVVEELQKVKAEKEVYRLKIESLSNGESQDPAAALQEAFVARAAEYEREIATLKAQIAGNSPKSFPSATQQKTTLSNDERTYIPNLPPRTPSSRSSPTYRERSESPELSRLRAQMFGSMSQSNNLDAEVEAEEQAVAAITNKYLRSSDEGDEVDDSRRKLEFDSHQFPGPVDEGFAVRLEAEVFELSTSITAKEDLIQKLQVSQEKYEAMREFYEQKLKEMESMLAVKEEETDKLSEDLKKLDKNHSSSHELAERLKKKQQQVAELKKKQAELSRLTSVASKNESQISKLRSEVVSMKQKKVDLQKQITSERKSHAVELQKLKKESIQKEKELSRVKKIKDQKAMEAQKAQQVAKSRLEQVNQLKSKYKESEKQLRLQTVKRGVMTKAGLDAVMVGRRQPKNGRPANKSQTSAEDDQEEQINVDNLRDFFDEKVADVGRREALAEKLAHEWEEHLELSMQREDLSQGAADTHGESVEALESEIKYKEDRIRLLASRLGKRQRESTAKSVDEETFLFDRDFKRHSGSAPPLASARVAGNVLFGMVVRERRRIASLARTASSLDEKVQEAEAAAAAKDAAFRAYVDEQRIEAAELAQNQQEHILSLMDMVREQPTEGSTEREVSSPVRSAKARHSEKANSKLLLLANERIAVLERQLGETQLAKEAIQKHREREGDARSSLENKSEECEILENELNDLRTAMRQIREEVSRHGLQLTPFDEDNIQPSSTQAILQIIVKALHPPSLSDETKKFRRRRSSSSKEVVSSPKLSIKRQTDFTHTSDSDGDVPDWADDIMQDLAIIAEGKMPTSLMESPEVVNAGAQLESSNVFDRLADPGSYTGVQKQRTKDQSNRLKKSRPLVDSTSDGQQKRKLISRQVADSLERLVVPGEPSLAENGRRSSEDRAPGDKDDNKKRTVFDRLLSPSNLTGTQKQRFQDKQGKRENSGSFDNAYDDSAGKEKQPSKTERSDERRPGVHVDDDTDGHDATKTDGKHSLPSSGKRDGYKDLDVYERLNKTTTQAYAVKQHVNIAERMLGDLLEKSGQAAEEPSKPDPHSTKVKAYAQQNVFERLQKTTTQAYAVKQHNKTAEKIIDDVIEKREGSSGGFEATSPPRSRPNQRGAASPTPTPGVGSRQRSGGRASEASTAPPISSENGSFSKVADKMLADILDEDTSENDAAKLPDGFTPISSRLRSRRKAH